MHIKSFYLGENISHESIVGAKGKFIMSTIGFTIESDTRTESDEEILAYARKHLDKTKELVKEQIKASYDEVASEEKKTTVFSVKKNPFKRG